MGGFWHVLRGLLICLLAVAVFVSAIFLWPVYLGILILKPESLDWLFSFRVF